MSLVLEEVIGQLNRRKHPFAATLQLDEQQTIQNRHNHVMQIDDDLAVTDYN